MTAPDRRSPPALEQRVEVETPEQVVLAYTIAGVGSRIAAAILDSLLCALILIGVAVLVTAGVGIFAGAGTGDTLTGRWGFAIVTFAQFLVLWCYYVLWEGLADGQTPGKRRLGLRVVQDGGYSVSFAASAVRNLVRIVDLYGIGVVSMLVTRSGKRLGDLAAGTMVVHERVGGLAPPPPIARTSEPVGDAPLATLLTDDEFDVVARWVARRQTLDPARRQRFAAQFATRFRPRLPDFRGSDAALLLALHERERRARARGVAARSDTGARREQHAIVAAGQLRWARFAQILADARQRGLAALSEDEVGRFVAEYRELSVDLARLRTASRGRDSDALFQLGRLVAGAHNLLYRRRALGVRAAWQYLAVSVPREIRRSWRVILLAATLFYGPALIAYVAVRRDPALASRLVPASLVERAQSARERELRGGGYLPPEEARLAGPVMTSLIMTNNVQVSFVSFAGGMLFGLGTVLALVNNGIMLGAPLALWQNLGVLQNITAFIAPHGVVELQALLLAGSAGLLLGSAILLPGALTRREALVLRGRRAMRLLAGCVLLLVCAGCIEGTISPSGLPHRVKYGISLATAVLLVLYVAQGRGADPSVAEDAPAYR